MKKCKIDFNYIDKSLEEMGIRSFLESLVMNRFDTITQLKKYLKSNSKDYLIELKKVKNKDYNNIDYCLVGSFQNIERNVLCYFDICYAKARNGDLIITEVNYGLQ